MSDSLKKSIIKAIEESSKESFVAGRERDKIYEPVFIPLNEYESFKRKYGINPFKYENFDEYNE